MLTTWEYSEKTEAERLIHGAHQIVVGFYKTNGFVVLPFNPNSKNINVVSFPDLNYNSIPRFWDQMKRVNVKDIPMNIDSEITNRVINLMRGGNLQKPEFEKTRDLWEKAESEVLAEIYKVIPSKQNSIKR
jgi:hypothetical protein